MAKSNETTAVTVVVENVTSTEASAVDPGEARVRMHFEENLNATIEPEQLFVINTSTTVFDDDYGEM